MKKYPVLMGSTTVGWVTEVRSGLYARFECRCSFDDGLVHRLELYTGGKQIDLGVFIPEEGSFVVRKRIPIKELPQENPEFWVDHASHEVYLWQEGEDLPDADLLKKARLQIRDGVFCLVINESVTGPIQCQPGNGPIPSLLNK